MYIRHSLSKELIVSRVTSIWAKCKVITGKVGFTEHYFENCFNYFVMVIIILFSRKYTLTDCFVSLF